jgi:hypothetical protein
MEAQVFQLPWGNPREAEQACAHFCRLEAFHCRQDHTTGLLRIVDLRSLQLVGVIDVDGVPRGEEVQCAEAGLSVTGCCVARPASRGRVLPPSRRPRA